MILTAQEEYGLRCALSLARVAPGESLTLSQVAEAEGLTTAYAGKLMRLLVQAGLVESTRGRTGGYSLTRDPGEITVTEVVGPLGGPFYDGEICTKTASAVQHIAPDARAATGSSHLCAPDSISRACSCRRRSPGRPSTKKTVLPA